MDSLDEYSTTISSDSGYEDSSEDYTLDTYTYAGVNTLLSSNKFDASESGSNEEPLKTLNCPQQKAENTMMVAGSDQESGDTEDDEDDEDDNTSVEEDDVFLDAKSSVPTMNKVVPVSSLRKVVEITPLSCALHDKQLREEEEALQRIAEQGGDEDFETVTIVQEFPKMSAPLSLASKGVVPLSAYTSQEIVAFKLEQDAKDLSAMKEARATKQATLNEDKKHPISLSSYSALKASQDKSFVSLDNYSTKEIADFKLAQDARASSKQTTLKSVDDMHCTPSNTYNAKKIEALKATQDKQYTNISRKTVSTQNNSSFVSLDNYSVKEIAGFKLAQDARDNVKTSTTTTSLKSTFMTANIQKVQRTVPTTTKDEEATPLSSLSSKALRELELSKKTMIYSLKNVSSLSAAKQEEFHAQQKPTFQSDRIRTLLKSPLMQPQKVVSLSHPQFKDPFARISVDELGLEELRELVRECRAHHDSSNTMPNKSVLSNSVSVATPLSKRLFSPQVKQCIKSDTILLNRSAVPNTLPETGLLCNINSLPLETRTSILSSLKPDVNDTPIVFQNHSTLSNKKAYELKLSTSVFSGNPKVLSLYHGLSTKTKSALELACPCPQVTESPKMTGSDVFDYMTNEYPLYSQLLKKNISPRLLNELSERNVMFLVPGRALMAILRQQGEMMKALAYLTMLMSKGESIPSGSDHYAVNTLVKNSPITIRRIDDETLEVDSSIIAKLDPTSEGRVYMMIEPSIEDLDTETAATIIASEQKAEADAKNEDTVNIVAEQVGESESELEASELDNEEEPEEEMVDESMSSTTTTTTTTTTTSQPPRHSSPTILVNVGAEPTLIRTLPADEELAIVKVEEQSPVASDANALALTGVFKNTQYKNRKFETLATKMVEKGYNGQVDMANYISQTNSCAPQLFLKTFSYDSLYDKYRGTATAMSGLERLTPVASFSIEHKNNLNYELDSKLKMKEFIVDSQKMNITKRQLIDHFNVLCFKTKANNQYAVASFTLPDVNTDTFMSADENLLLKFQDNLLHSVTINTNGANFMLTTLAAQKNAFLGKDSNVMKHINAQVSLDSAKAYAKELSYAQFVSTMLAATKPSWFQRVKAGFRQVTGSEVIQLRTLEADEIETFNRSISTATVKMDDLSRRREALVNVPVSIAKGVVGVVRGSMFVNFNRAELVSTDGQIRLRYQYNPGSDKGVQQQPILFEKLLWGSNSSAQDQPRLTLEIPSPLKRGNPEQVFRFHISVPGRSIPQGTVYYYGAAREKEGDIRFTFVVKDGVLTEIYIVAKPVNTYNTRISPFDKNIAKFLASESYAFKKHGLDLPYSYMNSRFSKYLVKSGLTKDKLDTLRYREYFSALNKEIKTFMVKHKLDALLTDAPKDSVLTLVTANILHTTNYQSPLVEESKRYQSLLLSGFSPLSVNATTTTSTTTNTAPQVLKLAIREYKTLSGTSKLRNQAFALYMDRFLHITSTMANASWL